MDKPVRFYLPGPGSWSECKVLGQFAKNRCLDQIFSRFTDQIGSSADLVFSNKAIKYFCISMAPDVPVNRPSCQIGSYSKVVNAAQ